MSKKHKANKHTERANDPNGGQYVPFNPQYDSGYSDGYKAAKERIKELEKALAEAQKVAEFNFQQYQDVGRLLAEECEKNERITASADAKCHNDDGNCGAGGYCADCHTPSEDAKDAALRLAREAIDQTINDLDARATLEGEGSVPLSAGALLKMLRAVEAIDAAMQKGGVA